MALQHFLVNGRNLGSRTIPTNRIVPGLEVRRHYSIAYFCPRCGDIWGRILHEGAKHHHLVQRHCAEHGDGRLSNWHHFLGDPHNFEADWPPPAIQYEFERLLEHFSEG